MNKEKESNEEKEQHAFIILMNHPLDKKYQNLRKKNTKTHKGSKYF